MRKSTAQALINLAKFLKPLRTDLVDDGSAGIDTELHRYSQMYLEGEFNGLVGQIASDDPDFAEVLTDPLNIVRNQILAPQGLSQIIFAFDFITNVLPAGSLAAQYDQNLSQRPPDTTSAPPEQSYDFNGLLQSPAGGFVMHNHQAVYEMYPPAGLGGSPASLGLRTQKILDADFRTPTKANPTFGYIAILDPRYGYSLTESEIASTMTRTIPTLEFSKAVPYFNLSISSESSTPNEDGIVTNDMSYNKFFEGGLISTPNSPGPNVTGLQSSIVTGEDGATTSGSMNTSIGMEAFTMPQSIAPMGQPVNAYRDYNNAYASVDPARPFMSVDSFNVSVSPTRGSSSTQRGKMTLTIHDRARLREVGNLLKPATLNKVEFTIEYGWSHPQGNEIHNNVYGQLINSMRSKGTFSLSNCGYSFTDDGQVKVNLDMVCKGVEAINVIDCAFTGHLAALSDVVERSFDALALARDTTAQELGMAWVQELTATQQINTLTLGSVGSLVSGDTATAIDEWIRKTTRRSSPEHLREFSRLLDQLRSAAQNMNSALIDDLKVKVGVIEQKSYNDWSIFTHGKLLQATAQPSTTATSVPFYNGANNNALESGWDTKKGSYAPLGALLQLFLVHPLQNSGQYDEVQLITYTANLNSSISAGANLGALPIDMKKIQDRDNSTFFKVLENEYKLNGGQYPINRFIRFVNETYIQPHMSSCYGFGDRNSKTGSSALKYNRDTGEMTADPIDGAAQAKIAKAIRNYYYESTFEGDPFDPRPTTFKPITLKIVFDVSKGDAPDITAQAGGSSVAPDEFSEKTVLRIHVFDEASGDRPGITNVLHENISKGVIIPGVPKEPAGMSRQLREILLPEGFNFNDTRKVCKQLEENGILRGEAWDPDPAGDNPATSPAQVLQRRLTSVKAILERSNLSDRERRRFVEERDQIDLRLGSAIAVETAPAQAYSLVASTQLLIDYCAQSAPNIVYGEEGSSVQQISIKSRTDSRQASMFMRRALDGGGSDTNVTRGVPMRLMPADMGIDMLGNPNIKYMQKFFIKLGTGTSFDNLYGVSGITHNITPDSFKTTLKLVTHSAYGVFNSLVTSIDDVKGAIDTLANRLTSQTNARLSTAASLATTGAAQRLTNDNTRVDTAKTEAELTWNFQKTQWDRQKFHSRAMLDAFIQDYRQLIHPGDWTGAPAPARTIAQRRHQFHVVFGRYRDWEVSGMPRTSVHPWAISRLTHLQVAMFQTWSGFLHEFYVPAMGSVQDNLLSDPEAMAYREAGVNVAYPLAADLAAWTLAFDTFVAASQDYAEQSVAEVEYTPAEQADLDAAAQAGL